METQIRFLLKVVIVSVGLSILIKYVGPSLFIPATSTNALILVLLPSIVMAIALGIRYALITSKKNWI